MNTRDVIWQELGDKLFQLEHKKFLSELPADHQKRLELTEQERRELTLEIFQTKRQILVEARAFHVAKWGADGVPKWLTDALAETVAI